MSFRDAARLLCEIVDLYNQKIDDLLRDMSQLCNDMKKNTTTTKDPAVEELSNDLSDLRESLKRLEDYTEAVGPPSLQQQCFQKMALMTGNNIEGQEQEGVSLLHTATFGEQVELEAQTALVTDTKIEDQEQEDASALLTASVDAQVELEAEVPLHKIVDNEALCQQEQVDQQ